VSKIVIHGTEYERVTLDGLDLLQLARACRELDITPARIEAAMMLEDEVGESLDRLLALAVIIFASRLAAGEHHPTVASAVAGVPLADIDWKQDDEPEEEADPTQPPEGSGADGSPDAPSDG
jgi:hypothetical protein